MYRLYVHDHILHAFTRPRIQQPRSTADMLQMPTLGIHPTVYGAPLNSPLLSETTVHEATRAMQVIFRPMLIDNRPHHPCLHPPRGMTSPHIPVAADLPARTWQVDGKRLGKF
jgi:hypothetical protein